MSVGSYSNDTVALADNTPHTFEWDDHYETNLSGFNFFGGIEVNDNLAIELGYFRSEEKSKNDTYTGLAWVSNNQPITTSSKIQISMASLDAIYKIDAKELEGVKLLLIGGLSHIDVESSIMWNDGSGWSNDSENGTGINLGLGSEVSISDKMSLRLIGKYTTSNISEIDSITSYSIGLKYNI